MGGDVTVESELGKGTKFTASLRLKRSYSSASGQALPAMPKRELSKEDDSLRKILIIDDDPTEESLSKALDTIVSNSAEMTTFPWCAYFTGKWNTDPLYKKVLATYKNKYNINLPFETLSHENEKTYAYNQTLHILTRCGIDVKRV